MDNEQCKTKVNSKTQDQKSVQEPIDHRLGAFITGTHAYGPLTTDSDFDVVMMEDSAKDLLWLIQQLGYDWEYPPTASAGNYETNSFYYWTNPGRDNTKVNIISMNSEDRFHAWAHATCMMKTLPPIKSRQKRLETFLQFRQEWYSKDLVKNDK